MTVPARLLGRRVVAVDDLTRPWATAVRTSRVTLEDGLVVVHQAGLPTMAGRAGIARRIRLGRALAAAAPAIAVPRVLDADPAADPPFVLLAHAAGVTGGELLATPDGAPTIGRIAGETARAIAAVPVAALGPGLPRRWVDAPRLSAAARRWLDEARAHLSPAEVAAVSGVVTRIPGLLADRPALAHGDLAPVNLVVSGERLAGLLDLERLRLAPLLFDAAWFRLMVRHHHPERWPDAGAAFMEAAGLGVGLPLVRQLDDLAVLACLEQLAGLPRRSPARAAWAARAREVLRRELPGP